MNRFIIFDRDGTLIEHVHHLRDETQVVYTEGLFETLMELKSLNFKFGIVTNQSVIGRGLATTEIVESINHSITRNVFRRTGILFEFIKMCPHHPEDSCFCRKPRTGLIKREIEQGIVNAPSSYVVGDSATDMEFGKKIGATTIQILNNAYSESLSTFADYRTSTFRELSNIIEKIEQTRIINEHI